MKRFVALFLSVCLAVTLVPAGALGGTQTAIDAMFEGAGASDEAYPDQDFFASAANGVSVTVTADAGAFAEGTDMSVAAATSDEALAAAQDAVGDAAEVVDAVGVDITFTDASGAEVQPADPSLVHVTLTTAGGVEGEEHVVVHVSDAGAATEVAASIDEAGTTATFDSEGFSMYVIAGTDVLLDPEVPREANWYEDILAGDSITLESYDESGDAYEDGQTREHWWELSSTSLVSVTTGSTGSEDVETGAITWGTSSIELTAGETLGSVTVVHRYEYDTGEVDEEGREIWSTARDTVTINILSNEVPVTIEFYTLTYNEDTGEYESEHNDGEDKDATIASGIIEDHVPEYDKYVYTYASVKTSSSTESGPITYIEKGADGNIYYYITNGKTGVGMLLEDGEQIVLHYETGIKITKVKVGDGGVALNRFWALDDTARTGTELEFAMNFVRGYQVTSVVVTPTNEGETFTDGSTSYTLPAGTSGTSNTQYEIPSEYTNVDITVTATWEKLDPVSFDWSWWTESSNQYTSGRYKSLTTTAASGTNGDTSEQQVDTTNAIAYADQGDNGATFTWTFTTNPGTYVWQLDSLEIARGHYDDSGEFVSEEGVHLEVPIEKTVGSSATTLLFSDGTDEDCVATIEITAVGGTSSKPAYTYKVTVTGAKENLKIVAGNLNNVTWAEVIPTIDDYIYFNSNASGVNLPSSLKNAVNWTADEGGLYQFSLKEGCSDLTVTAKAYNSSGTLLETQVFSGESLAGDFVYNDTTIMTIAQNTGDRQTDGENTEYMAVFPGVGSSGVTLIELEITGTLDVYHNWYEPAGKSTDGASVAGTWSAADIETVGVDDWSFDLLNNNILTVTEKTPHAPDGYKFVAWALTEGATSAQFYGGDTLDLNDYTDYLLEDTHYTGSSGCITFYPVYRHKTQKELASEVKVRVFLQNDDGTYSADPSESYTVDGVEGKTQVVVNVKDYSGYTYVEKLTDVDGKEIAISNTSVTVAEGATIDLYYMKDLTVTISPIDVNTTYDGEAHSPGYTVTKPSTYTVVFVDELPSTDETLTAASDTSGKTTTTTTTFTSSATYKDVADSLTDGFAVDVSKIKVYDANGNDVTDYITFQVTDGTVQIDPVELTVATASASKTYDGTALTKTDGYTLTYAGTDEKGNAKDVTLTVKGGTASGLPGGETVGFAVTGSQTYVGSSDNTYALTFATSGNSYTAKAGNYTVVSESLGTLTVKAPDNKTDQDGKDDDTGEDDDDEPSVTSKTHDGDEYKLGQTITFTITAKNIYDEARTITITEPDGFTLEGATNGSLSFADVAPGKTVTATATHVVTEDDIKAGEVKNTATIAYSHDVTTTTTEPDPDDPTKTIEVTTTTTETDTYTQTDTADMAEPSSSIDVKVTVTNDPANGESYDVGETITYDITVTNTGDYPLTDVTVTDPLTGETWTIDELAPGESTTYSTSYTPTTSDRTKGSVGNEVTATGTDPEGNTVSDSATATAQMVEYYTITYDTNGGTWTDTGTSENRTEAHPVTTGATIREAPVREGYIFLYWKGSTYYPGDTYHEKASDGDYVSDYLVAQWKRADEPASTPKSAVLPKMGDPFGGCAIALLAFGATLVAIGAVLRRRSTGQVG